MMIARLSFMICFYEYMYSLLTIKKRYVFVIIYKLTYRFNLVVVIDLGHNLGFFFCRLSGYQQFKRAIVCYANIIILTGMIATMSYPTSKVLIQPSLLVRTDGGQETEQELPDLNARELL